MIYDSACAVYNFFDECRNDNTNHIKALLLIQNEMLEQVLSPKQKEIVGLVVMQGRTQTEVAKLFNVSKSTICREVKKSLSILKTNLFFCDKALKFYENLESEV